jgi:hypothetical protein
VLYLSVRLCSLGGMYVYVEANVRLRRQEACLLQCPGRISEEEGARRGVRTSSPMTARNCLSLYCAVEAAMLRGMRRELSWAWGSLRLDSFHGPSVVIAQDPR